MITFLAKKFREVGQLKNEIVINVESLETRIAFVEKGILEAFHIERRDNNRLIGNIYKGKVVNVLPGIQAAFVDVGLDKNGFLHVSDIGEPTSLSDLASDDEFVEKEFEAGKDKPKEPERDKNRHHNHHHRAKPNIQDLVKEGDEIIVQVLKEPIGTKGVRLTTEVSLPGRFLVLVPNSNLRGISRKIEEREQRRKMRDMLTALRIPNNMGVILRTVGAGETTKDFDRDLRYLIELWKRIKKRIEIVKAPGLVHTELDLVLQLIRDSLTHDVDRVVVDSKEVYWDIVKFIGLAFPRMKQKVELYKGRQPLFDKYGIEKEIEKIFKRKVWLKKGGYLVFDRTEALMAIDVNTGRHMAGNLEDTVLETNLEACDEVARQLRLRNMGGIIIIDFIDMASRRNQREVLRRFKDAIKRDKAKTNILPISELGLVEMTRQRIQEMTAEILYQDCPYCKGNGMVKSCVSLSIEIQRTLSRIFSTGIYMDVKVVVSPAVYNHIETQDKDCFKKIEKKYRGTIILGKDENFHIEELKYLSAKTGDAIKV
ncbi:MAG TPA: Rne/Rng family ribonuclease [bacterium]|nr:Rne/Rng family ribonuclease [bacterium]